MSDMNMRRASLPRTAAQVRPLGHRSAGLLEAMTGLFEQGQKPHHRSFPEHFGPGKNHEAIATYFKGFLKPRNPFRSRTGFAIGLFIEDNLVGYLLYKLNQTNDVFYGRRRWHCYVEDIVVDQSARGLGGASALMSALLAETSSLGNCSMSGTVWDGNAASQALFQKHGFEPLSQSFYKVLP